MSDPTSLLTLTKKAMAETTRERHQRLQKTAEEYVTGLQAAEIKGISSKSVYAAIKRGALPTVKIGNQHLIHRNDLEQYRIIGHNPPKAKRRRPWLDTYKEHQKHERACERHDGILPETDE